MDFEKCMVLYRYFLNFFGVTSFSTLKERLKDVVEGYDIYGRSYFVKVLIDLKPEIKDLLLKFDKAIHEYVERLRWHRSQSDFNFRYFQYLAILFTEAFLYKYYGDELGFLEELNEFLKTIKCGVSLFTREDIRKLAFWMATGSGKTLIMHVNYWQILKYSKGEWDNILLITPNEGLSRQHYEELRLSGIPCKMYKGSVDDLKTEGGEVLVVDIHKLTEKKRGRGVSIDISYFDGRNLVFIDEGHKGQRSEEQKWKRLREGIGKDGFLFEYSATFGQVIGKNGDLFEEYAKSIIFDYSYKYFYADGYGKNFDVCNIRENAYSDVQRNLIIISGLLSFYEQLLIFEKYQEELRRYNIEKPLWVFVGSKVAGKGLHSDVVEIVKFFDRVTKDENFLRRNVEEIMGGESGLVDGEGRDIFKNKFCFIRGFSIGRIVDDIYRLVFIKKGGLKLYHIKGADGEIGLKTDAGEKYFGVINVGNVSSLKKVLRECGIDVKDDPISSSLFFDVNEPNSSINVLIGSKKFIEGWNSWRVSSMGLINMGKREGPQIIQLFGRGVRLKGKDYSLKREEVDYKLDTLQTLFIFGLNADYINAFLTAIEKEGVVWKKGGAPVRKRERTLAVRPRDELFSSPLRLYVDETVLKDVKVDLRAKITVTRGLITDTVSTMTDGALEISDEHLDIIDWNLIYSEVLKYKVEKGMFNLIVEDKVLREVMRSKKYRIFMNDVAGIRVERVGGKLTFSVTSFEGVEKFHDVVLAVIKSYVSKFYERVGKKRRSVVCV